MKPLRNACRLVGWIVVCAVMWGCAEKKDNFMATAQGLQARTLYGPAETEYRRALKEDPTNAEAHYRLGNTVGAEYRADPSSHWQPVENRPHSSTQ